MPDDEPIGRTNFGRTEGSTLTDREHVRTYPSMYLGSTDKNGLHLLAWEIVQNSICEFTAGFAQEILVTVHADGSLSIEDDGRGIPIVRDERRSAELSREFTALEGLMTLLNYPSQRREFRPRMGGLHGLGMAVVNFLTKRCEVEVRLETGSFRQVYERGVPLGPLSISSSHGRRGTKTVLWPDDQIFAEHHFCYEVLREYLLERAYLHRGLRLALNDENRQYSEVLQFHDGAAGLVRHLQRHRAEAYLPTEVAHIGGQVGDIEFEVALGYAKTVVSFVNDTQMVEGGEHEAAFYAAFTAALNEVAQNRDLLDGLTLTRQDYDSDLAAVIFIRLPEPTFGGPMRTRLENPETSTALCPELKRTFCEYLERHPVLIDRAIQAAKTRLSAK